MNKLKKILCDLKLWLVYFEPFMQKKLLKKVEFQINHSKHASDKSRRWK